MDFLHALLLGLIQGLTEFLPISSSAHLILLPRLMQWPDQGRAADVAAHVGSLLAVLWYFRRDVAKLCGAWFASLSRPPGLDDDSRLAWFLLAATLPLLVGGAVMAAAPTPDLRHPLIIAAATMIFALLLWWADARGTRQRGMRALTLRDALIIGAMQTLALIPGTSRAGITITAGLLLGLDRRTAARFSFWLAIPAILLAGVYEFSRLLQEQAQEQARVEWASLSLVAAVSFAAAWLAIHCFLRLLDRITMLPFVIYRLCLGAWLFILFAPLSLSMR